MTIIDDTVGASTADIWDELIFLIASASTDAQRKYATDLFRHFARQVALEAYQLGQRSVAPPETTVPNDIPTAPSMTADQDQAGDIEGVDIKPSDAAALDAGSDGITIPADHSVSLIPQVRWQD